MGNVGQQVRHGQRSAARSEAGFTLVEMLAAIVIIGVILTALAQVLFTSLRTTMQNEREVAATALVTREIERFQAAPWDQAGLLETETTSAPAVWGDRVEAGLFEGEELVHVTPPEGAVERPSQVPLPSETSADLGLDTPDFNVLRYVTSVDRNDGIETRRFTVIVTWEVLGRPRTLIGSGERNPLLEGQDEEATEELRVLSFRPEPDPAVLDTSGRLVQPLAIEVRLNGPVNQAWMSYYTASATETFQDVEPFALTGWDVLYEPQRLAMSLSTVANTWTVTIPAGTDAQSFIDGVVPLRFVAAEPDGATFVHDGSVRLIHPDPPTGTYPVPPARLGSDTSADEDVTERIDVDAETGDPESPPAMDVSIASATILPPACRDPNTWQLSRDLVLTVDVRGLPTDGVIRATYTYRQKANTGGGQLATATENLTFFSGDASLSTYRLVLSRTEGQHFAAGDQIDFFVRAERDDGSNASDTTTPLTFTNEGVSPCL